MVQPLPGVLARPVDPPLRGTRSSLALGGVGSTRRPVVETLKRAPALLTPFAPATPGESPKGSGQHTGQRLHHRSSNKKGPAEAEPFIRAKCPVIA